MEWNEDALILGTKRHGETSLILEVMTRAHGRHRGLVRGGRSRKMQPTLQAGNRVNVTWRARIEDHLGVFGVEALELRAATLMESNIGLHGIQTLAALLRLLPEREPHKGLADAAEIVIENFDNPVLAAGLIVRFELALLDELGFGLDLERCAATGTVDDLVYVSPKSGRAVSAQAGKPYHEKMLILPSFLKGNQADLSRREVGDAFALTAFFLNRYIYVPRGVAPPLERAALRRDIERAINQ